MYTFKVKANSVYQIMPKKVGYIADSLTGVTVGTFNMLGVDLVLRNSATATDVMNVSGNIYLGSVSAGNLAKLNARVWAQGYNADGTKNEKWVGVDTDANGSYTFKLQKGYIWKLSARSDGYEKIDTITIASTATTDQTSKDMTLDLIAGYTIKSPTSTTMNANNG